ncbi:large subunit ribosomal protein L30 [Paucidesulfovibrio gracilis DSM 16080]|jgi:large subunit ribosomal protein L30|uniref:50S ribosomal protein L30 n=1 Tax=Paucidesulfovibrio gracilis DSM 16080 TaxID=1121449 RepID=A0A1T4WBW2_9BACT|nr:50S ribosomal protein L30 [Paucidesulfovibrio gracilis]SKA74770.1 large subunit ribosomal protein L30 [Paucidesulfovibrio gracilis DSM 16080]
MAQVTVRLVKSKIGCSPKQRATLEALGLRKIRQENSFEDSPVVQGMINKVKHLVEVVAS